VPRVRDVLIVPTNPDPAFAALPEWQTAPPAGWNAPFDLGDGITIEKLDGPLAEAVMDASEPAGENFQATRQWSQLVSFVREVSEEECTREGQHGDNWDSTRALNETIALSRLVHDNAFCSEYAGRVIEPEGAARRIVPVANLEMRLAYRLSDGRPWLTANEATELAALRTAYRGVQLPDRVKRAMWRTERSSHSPFLSEAVTNAVTGLEALLKTERHGATAQFTTRVPALAAALRLNLGNVNWGEVYAARSDASHGARIALFSPPGWSATAPPHPDALPLIAAAQTILRTSVRKAIENPQFRSNFDDDASVRAAFAGS
jgi:hypothetical protein